MTQIKCKRNFLFTEKILGSETMNGTKMAFQIILRQLDIP